MSDHEAEHDVVSYVLGELDDAEVLAFLDHLRSCPGCRREVVELLGLPGLLAIAPPAVEVPVTLRGRTLSAISHARVSQRRSRRLRLAAAAIASVVALGAPVLILLGRDDRRIPAVQDAAVVNLAGVAGSGASGRLTGRRLESGWALQLEVRGLAPLGADEFYECSYASLDSSRTPGASAGSFRVGPSGDASVDLHFWAGGQRLPVVLVTREPADGDPAPTGELVLTGTVPR